MRRACRWFNIDSAGIGFCRLRKLFFRVRPDFYIAVIATDLLHLGFAQGYGLWLIKRVRRAKKKNRKAEEQHGEQGKQGNRSH